MPKPTTRCERVTEKKERLLLLPCNAEAFRGFQKECLQCHKSQLTFFLNFRLPAFWNKNFNPTSTKKRLLRQLFSEQSDRATFFSTLHFPSFKKHVGMYTEKTQRFFSAVHPNRSSHSMFQKTTQICQSNCSPRQNWFSKKGWGRDETSHWKKLFSNLSILANNKKKILMCQSLWKFFLHAN